VNQQAGTERVSKTSTKPSAFRFTISILSWFSHLLFKPADGSVLIWIWPLRFLFLSPSRSSASMI